MATTMLDIARLAGVSKTTVSRVLNGKPDVDAATAERVHRAMEQAGYTPSARAVGLAKGRTRTIGMLVPSLSWPWVADVLQGAVDELELAGYGLLLYTTSRGEKSLAQFASQVSSRSFDGLLVVEPPNTIEYLTSLHADGLPVVLIDDRGYHPEFPAVVTTNELGGRQAAAELVASGRSRLAMIRGPVEYGCVTEREAGFLAEARDRGLPVASGRVLDGGFTEAGGFRAMQQLLGEHERVDGVFAQNDLMAIGALAALAAAGLRVPADVAVVGFDDIPSAAHTTPPLTTVRQPSRELAAIAARSLLDLLDGEGTARWPIVLSTSIVRRGTT